MKADSPAPPPIHALHLPRSTDAYALNRKTLHLRLRVGAAEVDRVKVVFADPFYWHNLSEKEMPLSVTGRHYDWFEVDISLTHSRYAYYFILMTPENSYQYGEFGLTRTIDPGLHGERCFHYQHLSESEIFRPPGWVSNAVFYLVFPDRFRRAGGTWDQEPGSVSTVDTGDTGDTGVKGGSLRGVTESLGYLKDLGITAIYFTPIFKAQSYHRYDITDYYDIDPSLGSKEDFRQMVQKAHEAGIRIVLDAVFNHCGSDLPQFQDLVEKGAESPYADWFYANKFPIELKKRIGLVEELGWEAWFKHEEGAFALEYETFAFTPYMPRFRTSNPEVQQYLIDVALYWIREYDIDGWRLDVADEVSPDFWRAFRKALKAEKPDAYIVGEIWYDARFWLDGTQFDAVMNYPVKQACMDFFVTGTLSASGMRAGLGDALMRYSWPVNMAMMNLIESHDTDRFLSSADGDRDAVLLAYAFIMFFPGAPLIYYGSELGMSGELPHGNRRPVNWDPASWDQELLAGMRELCNLRRKTPAVGGGAFEWLNAGGNEDLLAFLWAAESERVFVFINRGYEPAESPPVPGRGQDLRSAQLCGPGTLEVPARGYRIIRI